MSQSLISSDSSHQVSAAGPYASCCRAVAAAGELYPRHEKQTKKTGRNDRNRYKTGILMSRTRKLKGSPAASRRLKTFNGNP